MRNRPRAVLAGVLVGFALVLGAGVEFQNTAEEREYELPVTVEYNFAEEWKAILESS
ncbi:MAG TPA: hypothetical protein VGC54_02500 [Planctomycetota bacterium]